MPSSGSIGRCDVARSNRSSNHASRPSFRPHRNNKPPAGPQSFCAQPKTRSKVSRTVRSRCHRPRPASRSISTIDHISRPLRFTSVGPIQPRDFAGSVKSRNRPISTKHYCVVRCSVPTPSRWRSSSDECQPRSWDLRSISIYPISCDHPSTTGNSVTLVNTKPPG